MSEQLARASVVRVMDHGDDALVVGSDGVVSEFHGDSARLLRAVLELLQHPSTRDELFARLAAWGGGGPLATAAVDELLVRLQAAGVVVRAVEAGAPRSRPRGARVLLGISGAVSAVDAPVLVRVLQHRGHEVRVAMTRNARRFVSPVALAALTHQEVYRGLWQRTASCPVPHIDLARWADAVLVAPASATTLGRIAHGDCSDLVAAIAIATVAPVLVVPSMNPGMYAAPPMQRVLELLRGDGVCVVHPALGHELADPPGEREPVLGPAAPAEAVADLLELALRRAPPRPHPAP